MTYENGKLVYLTTGDNDMRNNRLFENENLVDLLLFAIILLLVIIL